MDKQKQSKKLPGFYIALCCCVIAVGIAGFLSQNANTPDTISPTGSGEEEPVNIISLNDTADEKNELEPPVISEPETEDAAALGEYPENAEQVMPAAVNVTENAAFADPVPPDEILEGYSGDTLKYNAVFCDWRSHNGVDIAANTGCSVCAAANGTVIDTGVGSFGGYITIDHGDGITAVYAQLNDITAAVGDYVKSGSVIGTIAESTGEETSESHLHYEIIKNGKHVDPAGFKK